MAGDSMTKDIVAKELISKPNAVFPLEMDDALFRSMLRELLAMDRSVIRQKAHKNRHLKEFLSSPKFIIEFAKMTGCSNKLPPMEYIEKQAIDGGFAFKKNVYAMSMIDYVFNKTRHGFAERDIPFDANHGVKPLQDVGECESPVLLRNLFVLENMNIPVCRFDPLIFCQSWMLALLRPKFTFRGLIACPKGDYGLVRMIVEVGNSKGTVVRNELKIPFKNGDDSRLGRFFPYEVSSPDYDFRPNHVFFFVCVFYVNQTEMKHRGMRIANNTVQCVLPQMPQSLDSVECNESFPYGQYDTPPHQCNYTVEDFNDPAYLKDLKKDFYAVLKNSAQIRNAEVEFAEQDIEQLLEGNLLGDRMEVDEDDVTKRKRDGRDEEEEGEEPQAKRPALAPL